MRVAQVMHTQTIQSNQIRIICSITKCVLVILQRMGISEQSAIPLEL